MNLRLSTLIVLLIGLGAVLIHAAVIRGTLLEDVISSSYFADTAGIQAVGQLSGHTDNPEAPAPKNGVVCSNVAVAWKSEITGKMMKASLTTDETQELTDLMAEGKTLEESLDMMHVSVALSAR